LFASAAAGFFVALPQEQTLFVELEIEYRLAELDREAHRAELVALAEAGRVSGDNPQLRRLSVADAERPSPRGPLPGWRVSRSPT
jgi:hypothetical protein